MPFLDFGEFARQAYRDRLWSKLPKKFLDGRGKRALDLGCGEGHEALQLSLGGYLVDAVDIKPSPSWKTHTQVAHGRINFRVGKAEALGSQASYYDLVYEKDMLHHAADPLAALKEMGRVAKQGGCVVLIEANRLNPVFYLHMTLLRRHQHFSRWRLKNLLQSAGIRPGRFFGVEARVWPFDSLWAQRWVNRLQDLMERIPPLRLFLCYHVVLWTKE